MPTSLLLELAPIHGRLVDSDGGNWVDSVGGIWKDGVSLLASQEGFAGNRYWGDYIISVDPPQYQLANIYGGYCSLGWGSVTLAQEIFNNNAWWPPTKKLPCVFYFTTSTEDDAELIFEGSAHLSEWNKEGVTYDLYGFEFTPNLLEEIEDYNGDTVSLPRALGNISFQVPVRLPDVGGKPTYHKAYLSGVITTNWHVYDDGISIDGNVVDNGNGTFSLNASPVGEVSISGTGEINTLDELFDWACDIQRFNLSYDNTNIQADAYDLSYWASNQTRLIDFLSDISSYFTHLFYIYNNTLYIVDMEVNNGTSTYTEHDILPVEYQENSPVSLYKSKWRFREPFDGRLADGSTTTYYVRETEKETSIPSNYGYGKEMEIEPYVETKTEMDVKLNDIKTIIERSNVTIGIPMEVGDLPIPGKEIIWTENGVSNLGPHILGIAGSIRARTITYDFKEYKAMITGDGTILSNSSIIVEEEDAYITDEFGDPIGDGFGNYIEDET